MKTLQATIDEVSNISSQLPLSICLSDALHYDPASQTLSYAEDVASIVEGADRTARKRRPPEFVSPLQARLELIARDLHVHFASFAEPERSVLQAIWEYADRLASSDNRVVRILHAAGVDDTDDFFIAAARQR